MPALEMPMKPLIRRPRWSERTRLTPATSRALIHMLSPAPAMNMASSIKSKRCVTAATKAPATRIPGPIIMADRVPNRSMIIPVGRGLANLPRAWAVTT